MVLVIFLIMMFHPFLSLPNESSFRPLLRTNSNLGSDSNIVILNGYAIDIDPNVASVIQHADGSVSVILNRQEDKESTVQSMVEE
jgi:hypothetical protein